MFTTMPVGQAIMKNAIPAMIAMLNLNMPIHRETLKHMGDPTFGDSQYYIQPIIEPNN